MVFYYISMSWFYAAIDRVMHCGGGGGGDGAHLKKWTGSRVAGVARASRPHPELHGLLLTNPVDGAKRRQAPPGAVHQPPEHGLEGPYHLRSGGFAVSGRGADAGRHFTLHVTEPEPERPPESVIVLPDGERLPPGTGSFSCRSPEPRPEPRPAGG
jgi:hypothetical protein